MLQEHTVGDILAKVREIMSEEVPAEGAAQVTSRAPEVPVAKRNAPPLVNVVDAPKNTRPRSGTPEPQSPVSPDRLEPVFASAFRDAISPPVQRWVESHQAELTRALTPMIQRWMDKHLPKLVESVLKEELGRAMVRTLGRST